MILFIEKIFFIYWKNIMEICIWFIGIEYDVGGNIYLFYILVLYERVWDCSLNGRGYERR